MAVAGVRELPRTFEREIAQPALLVRRWVVTLSDDTLQNAPTGGQEILAQTTGGTWGAAHPDQYFASWLLRKARMEEGYEGNPYLVLVTGEYSIVRDEEILTPVDRPAQWSFEASKGEFPALFYYDGSGNGTKRPLTNSAYDYFPGLTTYEALIAANVRKNFATLPTSWIAANNHINSDSYLGCPAHSIKVDGVSVEYVYEEFAGAMVKYWAAAVKLVYRQSKWNLQLPDIGWNFLGGGQKRRAMVFDFENGEWVASPNPVGLDGSGAQTGGAPAILDRRVDPEIAFQSLFGTPPT